MQQLYTSETKILQRIQDNHILIFTDGGGNRGGFGVQYNESSLWISGQNGIAFRTGGTAPSTNERLRITSDGKVGIGEDSPDRLLHIKGASSTAYSGGSDTADYNFLKIENTTNDKSAGISFKLGAMVRLLLPQLKL